jgi:hypothetical protein
VYIQILPKNFGTYEKEIESKTIICDLIEDKPCIFLASYHFYEKQIAKMLLSIDKEDVPWGNNNSQKLIPEIEQKLSISELRMILWFIEERIV